MDIYTIIFLILGLFFIFGASNGYIRLIYHKKSKYPKYPKLEHIIIFGWYLIGILFILGAITGYIWLAALLSFIIFISYYLYRKRKYPSLDLDIKEEHPKYAKINASFGIWAKIAFIISFLFLIIIAINNF